MCQPCLKYPYSSCAAPGGWSGAHLVGDEGVLGPHHLQLLVPLRLHQMLLRAVLRLLQGCGGVRGGRPRGGLVPRVERLQLLLLHLELCLEHLQRTCNLRLLRSQQLAK